MNRPRRTLGFLLRDIVSEESLLAAVARVLTLQMHQVCLLEAESCDDAVVYVEYHGHAAGFRTDVTLYVNEQGLQAPIDEIQLTMNFARHFAQDIIISPSGAVGGRTLRPYEWLLVKPSGELFVVPEVSPSGDDVIIDDRPSQLEQISVS